MGVEYNNMGMGQDHVADPLLWVVKMETRSLLLLCLLRVVGKEAGLLAPLLLLLLLLLLLKWEAWQGVG